MICVLNVLDGPACGKRICVQENQCFEIGRLSSSDFPITADSHLSRRHLLIDSTKQSFRVRDLGSANGTFVNNNRIDVENLRQGDLIRAGSSVFQVSFVKSGENPHESDGTVFGKTISSTMREPSEPQRTINFESLPESRDKSLDQSEAEKGLDLESTVLVNVAPKPAQAAENPKVIPSWQENFEPGVARGIFKLLASYTSPHGRFLGALELLSDGHKVSLIVNTSQISFDGPGLKPFLKSGHKVEPLANSLMLIHGESASDFQEFIAIQTTKDAFICLIHSTPLVAADLWEFANSFSFPSLFARHISQLQHPCRDYFELHRIAALYESDKQGQINLYLPSVSPGLK
ncbi:MAG: FHA domain-containing protein [Pirellula sp.]|jgi:pSer/pThr/pTyr-binding forkhead associated (FHA) protein|nr:FHA domain-containing protein [Pirellula sp.]